MILLIYTVSGLFLNCFIKLFGAFGCWSLFFQLSVKDCFERKLVGYIRAFARFTFKLVYLRLYRPARKSQPCPYCAFSAFHYFGDLRNVQISEIIKSQCLPLVFAQPENYLFQALIKVCAAVVFFGKSDVVFGVGGKLPFAVWFVG